MTQPPRLILDASAVREFPCIGVGEPICELRDEEANFGVPVIALSAAAVSSGHDGVAVLIANGAFAALDVGLARWRQLADAMSLVDDAAAAHALMFALESDCDILTAEPELYAGYGENPPIIAFDA
jgi:hypothetical protein